MLDSWCRREGDSRVSQLPLLRNRCLPVVLAALRGGVGLKLFFRALYTGTGPGGRVHRDTATIIRCIYWRVSTKTCVKSSVRTTTTTTHHHTPNHHTTTPPPQHHNTTTPPPPYHHTTTPHHTTPHHTTPHHTTPQNHHTHHQTTTPPPPPQGVLHKHALP